MTEETELSDLHRSELREEYFKLVEIAHKYDDYFIRIKTWGVTVSGAAAGIGITQSSPWIFFIASLLAFAFWVTESRFKILQLDHNLRIDELESALHEERVVTGAPRIYGALRERKAKHLREERWKEVMKWPHVMYPHVIFTVVGLLGGVALLLVGATK